MMPEYVKRPWLWWLLLPLSIVGSTIMLIGKFILEFTFWAYGEKRTEKFVARTWRDFDGQEPKK